MERGVVSGAQGGEDRTVVVTPVETKAKEERHQLQRCLPKQRWRQEIPGVNPSGTFQSPPVVAIG